MSEASRQLSARELWEAALEKGRVRDSDFNTLSGEELKPMYGPDDVSDDYENELGYPGQFPYTR
ncbi:MAG: methylmalonyl-CoA mutase family protein, partial [Planctomycetota bacterium]|nr:methylmalonyl-CoA mutase family protein [Planctomycetota bacterium]